MHKPLTNPRGLHVVAHDLRSAWEPPRWPVVFHHGIGTSHRIWDEWIPKIAACHTVWRFDTRGFGSSPCPDLEHSWSLEEMLDDLFSVIDQSGAEKVHLVGESLGGTIVLAAGLRFPERLASIQMSNASYKGAGLGELEHWQRQFADEGVIGWSRRMMENRFHPGADDPASLAWFADEQARTQPHVALGLGGLLAGLDLGPELPGLTVPLSVVLPGESPFVPMRHGIEICELTGHARLRIEPGYRHGLPFVRARCEAHAWLAFAKLVEGSS